jgi:proton-translocating NADH-quinone oxidoreductase chain L
MFISVIILPVLSAIIVGFFGRYFGRYGAVFIANFFVIITCLISWVLFYEVIVSETTVYICLWEWLTIGVLKLQWSFLFDALTCTMLFVITTISSLVHLYSIKYMENDPHIVRFMAYLSLFTFFMIILVTSGNFIQLFLGWEGVGVSSYLLINFWFTRIAANQAAIKAILINRVGDIGILVALLLIFQNTNTFDFGIVFSLIPYLLEETIAVTFFEINVVSCICFGLFVGAVGKSAQLGLHTWLPDAMEGPTPVSALIHAATMVTAGVFVLIRVSPILVYSETILTVITVFGALTAFFAGSLGIFQNDLKRVIAYSTCSQLGYMVMVCGLTNFSVALFHLMNHAFFKALLFLSAGSVIHAVLDEQDMRKMGGLIRLLPMTYSMFVIGSLALMGFPYTTGYYSKELIIEMGYANYNNFSFFSYIMLVFGAAGTAFYSIRLLYLTFLAETNLSQKTIQYVHESPFLMYFPMLFLGFGSIFVGYIFKDLYIGVGNTIFQNSMLDGENLYVIYILQAEFMVIILKLIPIIFTVLISIFTYILYSKYEVNMLQISLKYFIMYKFFSKKWFFDVVYNRIFVLPGLVFGNLITFKLIDRGFIEFFGPTGIVRSISNKEELFKRHISGYIFKGVFFMVINLLLYLNITLYIKTELDITLQLLYIYFSFAMWSYFNE